MKKNFLKEWWNAICYPMPVIWAPEEVWEEFANNATYFRVLKAFHENAYIANSIDGQKKLQIILRRLAKGNWPKLSEEFVREFIFEKLNARYVIVGTDWRFGKNRSGDVEVLKALQEKYM